MTKKFVIERGSKGPEDRIVRIWSYGEVITLEDILRILDIIFRSEDSYYPKPKFEGSCMLMKAILEVYSGFPVEQVLHKYKLDRKNKKTTIIEKLEKENTPLSNSEDPLEKLHEILLGPDGV